MSRSIEHEASDPFAPPTREIGGLPFEWDLPAEYAKGAGPSAAEGLGPSAKPPRPWLTTPAVPMLSLKRDSTALVLCTADRKTKVVRLIRRTDHNVLLIGENRKGPASARLDANDS